MDTVLSAEGCLPRSKRDAAVRCGISRRKARIYGFRLFGLGEVLTSKE
jgi:hypothetical protein